MNDKNHSDIIGGVIDFIEVGGSLAILAAGAVLIIKMLFFRSI